MGTGWSGIRSVTRLKGAILVVSICALANLLMYLMWVGPTVRLVAAQQAENQMIRQQLQGLVIYQHEQDVVDRVAQLFSSRTALPETISRVTSMGRRAGVSIPEINFEAGSIKSKQWGKVNLHFNASGRYTKIRRFLALLEASEQLFVIESLTLTKGSNTSTVVAKLVVGVYITEGA